MQRCWDQDPQQNCVAERKNISMLEAVKIKIFLCAYGQKQQSQLFMCRTDCPIVHLGSRHQKRCSPERSHLKIFGCSVFIRILKEKRNKLEPSGKKGIFVGYCEVSKAFIIYIPSHCHIEISRDVTFDEDAALKKSRRCQLEEVYEEEPVNPRTTESVREVPRAAEPVREVIASPNDETPEDRDITEVQEPPQMTFSHKRKFAWARELIQDGEKYGVLEGTTRQVKRPKPFSSYTTLMCNLLYEEPTCFEEAIQKKEWADAMTEEYQSIIKNDVWEIVSRSKNKDGVFYRWLFKIKHVVDGSIEKYKARFVARGFFFPEGRH
jgi:hypothetical protein